MCFFDLAPAHLTIHFNSTIRFVSSIQCVSSLCSVWYFCYNSLICCGLLNTHFYFMARHPLHKAFALKNSNPSWPLHVPHYFSHLFRSHADSETRIRKLAWFGNWQAQGSGNWDWETKSADSETLIRKLGFGNLEGLIRKLRIWTEIVGFGKSELETATGQKPGVIFKHAGLIFKQRQERTAFSQRWQVFPSREN